MPAARITAPNGVKSKNPNPAKPACWSALSATRFGGVPTSVSIPPINPAKLSGIISRPGASFCRSATSSTTGMKIATTPVELMTAPSTATASISKASSRPSLPAARRSRKSPICTASPVRTSPSPTMKSAAMSTTFGSLNPASASGTVTTPQSGSATMASSATTSRRGLLAMNNATHAPSRPRTRASRGFTPRYYAKGRRSNRVASRSGDGREARGRLLRGRPLHASEKLLAQECAAVGLGTTEDRLIDFAIRVLGQHGAKRAVSADGAAAVADGKEAALEAVLMFDEVPRPFDELTPCRTGAQHLCEIRVAKDISEKGLGVAGHPAVTLRNGAFGIDGDELVGTVLFPNAGQARRCTGEVMNEGIEGTERHAVGMAAFHPDVEEAGEKFGEGGFV